MNTNFRRSSALFVLLMLTALLWSGCAQAPSAASGGSPLRIENSEVAPAAEAAAPAAPAADMDMSVAQADAGVPGAPMQRQIISRVTIDLLVADTQKTVDTIGQLMNEYGGYVSNSNLYRYDYNGDSLLQGTIQLRIPANRLEAALKQLEGLAIEVRSKNLSREDVTDQYSDLDAQLRNLSATENELRELLAEVRAKPNAKPDDIMAVHYRLTEIRGQIEQIQGRKNVFDNLIGLATVDVTLTPDVINQPVIEEGWRPVVVAKDALRELVGAMQGLADAAIWVGIYFVPIVLLLAIPVGVLVWVVRWVLRRMWRKPAMITG